MKKLVFILGLIFTIFTACQINNKTTIYCIGDSTMANKKADVYPETGWCQIIGNYFDKTVMIKNHAVNGRSSKSFIDEGKWKTVLDSLKKGDYVFIQFGHNDEKKYDSKRYTTPFGTYSENLRKFINESRDKGAKPILFTSIVRRKFGEDGNLIDTHGDYPLAMRKVAKELNVPLIDLQVLTEKNINHLGDEPSKRMYLWTTKPSKLFPNGRKDDTHFSVEGANNVARIATEAIKKSISDLGKKVK